MPTSSQESSSPRKISEHRHCEAGLTLNGPIYDGSLVESGFEPGTLRLRGWHPTTWPPRPLLRSRDSALQLKYSRFETRFHGRSAV
ncbi:hypothetical protein AVEN_142526-1 [Araneus ventricosus]|uniref:Uncharacterized protein n=1 Tax=Araneus ventricosus TaxID=182803 RepID=A0A4Y2CGA0_ARAVE|nr:hypothetical protein AVEN_142526-1 [Araneus ventricosus]